MHFYELKFFYISQKSSRTLNCDSVIPGFRGYGSLAFFFLHSTFIFIKFSMNANTEKTQMIYTMNYDRQGYSR